MAPNVYTTNISVIFADQFFTQELIQSCGLCVAKLFYDHYHLQFNQQKDLGDFSFGQATCLLNSLLLIKNHDDFMNCLELILKIFPGKPVLNDLVSKYKDMELMIAAYVADETKFSIMRRGSTPSEQNHFSIVSYIGRDFCGELIEILAFLLQRHPHKNKKTNETIAKEDSYMRVIHYMLTE